MRICVYCSSSDAVAPEFGDLAEELGRAIAAAGHDLVYGGTAVGPMGRLADAVRAGGGHVTGVLPRVMVERGLADEAVDEQVVTEGMRDRKQGLEDAAEAFVVLPGGFGTLEELFEMLTMKQLGYHDKAIVLVDLIRDGDRFWGPLLRLFEVLYDEGFAPRAYAELYAVVPGVAEALRHVRDYAPPDVPVRRA